MKTATFCIWLTAFALFSPYSCLRRNDKFLECNNHSCRGQSSPPSGPAKLINFVGDSMEEYPKGEVVFCLKERVYNYALSRPPRRIRATPPKEGNLVCSSTCVGTTLFQIRNRIGDFIGQFCNQLALCGNDCIIIRRA